MPFVDGGYTLGTARRPKESAAMPDPAMPHPPRNLMLALPKDIEPAMRQQRTLMFGGRLTTRRPVHGNSQQFPHRSRLP